MKLLVGLGNPGEKYEKTRHNIGFMALEQLLKDLESVKDTVWEDSKKCKADIAVIHYLHPHVSQIDAVLMKPKTFMNNSGMAVRLAADFYKILPEDIWVIHDDVDLQLGQLRMRMGGGSAGHRGIESLLSVFPLGNFLRVRMGIGRPDERADTNAIDRFVLGEFSHSEHAKVKELLTRTSHALQMSLRDGVEAAMNKYNTK